MITGGTTVPTNCANCAECTFLYSAFAHTILLTSAAQRGKKLCVINNPSFLCYPVLDMEAIEDNPLKYLLFVAKLRWHKSNKSTRKNNRMLLPVTLNVASSEI